MMTARASFSPTSSNITVSSRSSPLADSAIRRLANRNFDVVLVDLLLPRTNGTELLRRIGEANPDMLERTIVVTAASELSPASNTELRSVWRLMHKPVDVDALTTEMMSCAAEDAVSHARVFANS